MFEIAIADLLTDAAALMEQRVFAITRRAVELRNRRAQPVGVDPALARQFLDRPTRLEIAAFNMPAVGKGTGLDHAKAIASKRPVIADDPGEQFAISTLRCAQGETQS